MSTESNTGGPAAADLVAKWENTPDSDERENPFNLRMRRATSWLARAEQEEGDADAAFIFHWIAFNAIYAENTNDGPDAFKTFFDKIIPPKGAPNPIFSALKKNYDGPRGPVRKLIHNEYVFHQFWDYNKAAGDTSRWESRFETAKRQLNRAFREGDTKKILDEVFGRLYVLRNQLIHGGATWQGSVNRDQVEDGAAIMAFLVPRFVNMMLDDPTDDWGTPLYAAGILLPSI